MASTNPFDLLGDDDNDDPSQLIAKLPVAVATAKKSPVAKPAAKLPSKPLPPSQAVREAKTDGQRGGGRFGGNGTGRGGRGGRGFNRDSVDNENSYGNNNGFSGGYNRPLENGDGEKPSERRGPRLGNRGGRRGGYSNGDGAEGERPRRVFERRSRGNWGTATDEVPTETEEPVTETEKIMESDKQAGQEDVGDANKENTVEEMTLEEYEKVLEEKRKALVGLKNEERKVSLDKDLAKMQLLSNKKTEEDIFVKLSVSIDEFLKPAEGERYNNGGGRGGRGRGRGFRGGYGGGNIMHNVVAPSIEDVGQFPSLSVK
ncbi:Hyaluronan/mRNA-binding protein [Cynara cardunculus var. scolymus]|uniref:Hyaluronan/mRNA-binding protein n=1 Tax=Cynara cardunculus var. scolymus TaxID=59895 RepID=A0A124SBX3_CYNCS|nr:Hyaluronan/mRNA-binding protein [Cynara cardunculus var. scolymus]